MKWQEYKEYLKDEWEFHKRHPEMLFVWGVYILAIIYCFLSDR
jgi:uncharacterized membrane protein